MTGRPTIRTEAMIDDILERVTAGEPLAQVLRSEGMPKPSTFYDWLEADAALSGRFARAREFGADAIAVDALRIADTPVEGVRRKVNEDGVEEVTEDMLGHRKLQVETRLKLLAKWDPKRYGDKLELAGKVDGNVTVVVKRHAPEAEPAT